METTNQLPPNVGAAVHPDNNNYIMFTTFDATNPDDKDIIQLDAYKEALKGVITVMEYEYFQSLVEAAEGDVEKAGKMFYVPQTIRKIEELPEGFSSLISTHCDDFGDETMAIVRFFEYDKKEDAYYPVDVQFDEDGALLQAEIDEEE